MTYNLRARLTPFWALLLLPLLLASSPSGLETPGDCPQKDVSHLPPEEQHVYQELGPLYQKIYLCLFTEEERHQVVVYTTRGLTSYEAINVLLRAEERKYAKKPATQKVVPSKRSQSKPAPDIL